jgi:hypothetical protein
MISSLYKDCTLKLDFKGHKGRPGKVGGSLPREAVTTQPFKSRPPLGDAPATPPNDSSLRWLKPYLIGGGLSAAALAVPRVRRLVVGLGKFAGEAATEPLLRKAYRRIVPFAKEPEKYLSWAVKKDSAWFIHDVRGLGLHDKQIMFENTFTGNSYNMYVVGIPSRLGSRYDTLLFSGTFIPGKFRGGGLQSLEGAKDELIDMHKSIRLEASKRGIKKVKFELNVVIPEMGVGYRRMYSDVLRKVGFSLQKEPNGDLWKYYKLL